MRAKIVRSAPGVYIWVRKKQEKKAWPFLYTIRRVPEFIFIVYTQKAALYIYIPTTLLYIIIFIFTHVSDIIIIYFSTPRPTRYLLLRTVVMLCASCDLKRPVFFLISATVSITRQRLSHSLLSARLFYHVFSILFILFFLNRLL